MGPIGGWFPGFDPKRVHRALFGVFYEEDIYDRLSIAAPFIMRALAWRIDPVIRARNTIFVHVPRVAGTSIAAALYGRAQIHHYSARYYQAVDPLFFAAADSFAVLRDPFDRFCSSYQFVRNGGTDICRLSGVFQKQTAHIRSVDDYLDFLESRGPYDLDFVMRTQSWFVSDDAGNPLVKRFFFYGQDVRALGAYLTRRGGGALPWLNRAQRLPLRLTAQQRQRIAAYYADDLALIARVQDGRNSATSGIAAE
jgi:hypothetical protein